ncbi:unnamed protein product [Ilex paraguariensis]|uniref:Uncharacterized protein n=1 Tax=Ilex paraguariensis TaxID=185542 RepID=A0ABC8T9G2_9AQUA
MGTTYARIDSKLTHTYGAPGFEVCRRKRNDDEDAKEKLYSLLTVAKIATEGLKGLGTKINNLTKFYLHQGNSLSISFSNPSSQTGRISTDAGFHG